MTEFPALDHGVEQDCFEFFAYLGDINIDGFDFLLKRGYVIAKGRKLLFGTTDMVIKMDDAKSVSGAWR